MKVQSTFSERVARIESGKTFGGSDTHVRRGRATVGKSSRRVHLDMIIIGSAGGGLIGYLFAMQFGLLVAAEMEIMALYELVQTDYLKAGLLGGVLLAPLGFVMSQLFSRGNPRVWQFWLGYLAAVLGTNGTDIQTYYYILTGTPA
jgi:hypothetical protein